jgi:hypothetical protein
MRGITITLALSFGLMVIGLLGEGVILMFAGFLAPGAPVHVQIGGAVWLAACTSLFVYLKWPLVTITASWTLLLASTAMWFSSSPEKTTVMFLYDHSLELVFLVAAHVGYLALLRTRQPANMNL